MKNWFYLLLFMLFFLNGFSQESLARKTKAPLSFSLNLGASGGFASEFSKTAFIPQPGIDLQFGKLGFRATGQFFKASPGFDVNGYLDPIRSVLTISNLKETNSNVLLGITPYLSMGKNAIRFQTGLGLKYLLQEGASASAYYAGASVFQVMKFPEGETKRTLITMEPHIRTVFGKPNKLLNFYVEASYLIGLGENEYTYTIRDLTGVIRDGVVNREALLKSKVITEKVNTIPNLISIGGGIAINLTPGKKPTEPREKPDKPVPVKPPSKPVAEIDDLDLQKTKDAKKALDAFINATTKAKVTVEQVQNAGIIVELIYKPMVRGSGVITTSDEMDIVGLGFEKKQLCITDNNGRFSIKLSDEILRELPEEFYFRFTVNPENPEKYQTETNSAILKANKSSGPEFELEVIFIRPSVKSTGTGNKGTFAVNSKAQT